MLFLFPKIGKGKLIDKVQGGKTAFEVMEPNENTVLEALA